MMPWRSKLNRYLRKSSIRYEKEHRGWRGIVLTRWFVLLVVAAVASLVENPWLAAWVFAVAVGGIVVAIIIRAVYAKRQIENRSGRCWRGC
jgi:hypothetical protein